MNFDFEILRVDSSMYDMFNCCAKEVKEKLEKIILYYNTKSGDKAVLVIVDLILPETHLFV